MVDLVSHPIITVLHLVGITSLFDASANIVSSVHPYFDLHSLRPSTSIFLSLRPSIFISTLSHTHGMLAGCLTVQKDEDHAWGLEGLATQQSLANTVLLFSSHRVLVSEDRRSSQRAYQFSLPWLKLHCMSSVLEDRRSLQRACRRFALLLG